ncbi:MAG: rRNA pseudouridine synthase [Clostridiales bacterium]|nr:rRNA pseudouridine synthase [Clostridiales bacterium]
MRVQKYISNCGFTSRRKAEALILEGKVLINDKTAQIGDKINPETDQVRVSGKLIKPLKSRHYIALYKPRGYLTTMSDDRGRKCVTDLVKELDKRIYPIGRLDKDSEGLLLLTDDGDFHNYVEHPKFSVPKVYRVTVNSGVTEEQITEMMTQSGMDSKSDIPVKINPLVEGDERSVLEFILLEGKNRQIRKLCQSVGLEVMRLKRVAVGPVRLGRLGVGKWRELTAQEIASLYKK